MRIAVSTLLLLCIVTISQCEDPMVVITSQKLNRVILDADRLKQHIQQNDQIKNYIVQSNFNDQDKIKLAKEVLKNSGIQSGNVNSFIMQANQFKQSVNTYLNNLQQISPEQLTNVLKQNPQSIIFFANKPISHNSRLLEQTQQTTSTKSQLFLNMTPSILSGLLVTIFLIIMLLIAVSCLYDVKTNDRFASTNLVVGKQS